MKTLSCSDVGFDCKAVIHADTEEEIMKQVAVHAEAVHGVTVTQELAEQVKTLIREEKSGVPNNS